MQNQGNPTNQAQIPPRANNYPVPNQQNQRPPLPTGAGQMFNNRPPMNNGSMFNNKPPLQPVVPQRTNVSVVPNQAQQNQMFSQNNQRPPVAYQNPPNAQVSPSPNGGAYAQPQQQIPRQFSNRSAPPVNNNYSKSSNVQVNMPQNIQQRRSNSQREPPTKPVMPRKSTSSLSRSASKLKTKFVDMVNRVPSIKRTLSTKNKEKGRRLSQYGGMNVHSAYRNSLIAKPVFDSKLLLKPQNPNFIISLGIVVMVAFVSLAIAFVSLRNGGLTEVMIHDISYEDTYGFIFFSMFLLLIALTGYISYHKKWTSLLITYSVFIIIGFMVQLIIISLFLTIYFRPVVQMRNKWVDVLTSSEKQLIQENYQCCGFLSVIDHGETTSMCFPDTGSTTLPIKSGKALVNSLSYIELPSNLRKRQVDAAADGAAGAAAADGAAAGGDGGAAGAGAAGAADGAAAAAGNQADQGAAAGGNAAAAGAAGAADATGTNATDMQTLKDLYKKRDPDTYTEADIKDEGCGRIIVSAVKGGLIYYILIEVLMALSFVGALYYAYMHFKEQLEIEKEIDSARATFG